MVAPQQLLGALVLELRGMLEGDGTGDLAERVRALGFSPGAEPAAVHHRPGLDGAERRSRERVAAHLQERTVLGAAPDRVLDEFVAEAAYGWANRLLALRCMEARELIDEVVVQKEIYGGRSLAHHRLAQQHPEACAGEDDGLFAVLEQAFCEQAERLPLLFDPAAPALSVRPSVACLQRCIALLSGRLAVRGGAVASADLFRDPAALGWAYQYWHAARKDRVFARIRSRQGEKVGGPDLVAATQLYTSPHLVQFLVQNSLGALWQSLHPGSGLRDRWPYLVRRAELPPAAPKPVRDIVILDPACGSGHFLLEAFELLYAMYEEEGELPGPAAICHSILERNLCGIDIDERAIQIAAAALWMKAAEKAFDLGPVRPRLVAANVGLPAGRAALSDFLQQHPEYVDHRAELGRLLEGLSRAPELGSLIELGRGPSGGAAQPDDDSLPTGEPPREDTVQRLGKLVAFLRRHALPTDERSPFFHQTVDRCEALLELLSRRFDVVVMNPPYAGFRTLAPPIKAYLQAADPHAQLDLYVAFLSRFFRALAPGGLLAAVTPASWMTSSRTVALRRRILQGGGPVVVAALGQRVFETAPLLFVSLQVLGKGARGAESRFVTLRPAEGGGAEALQQAVARGGTTWPCAVVAELDSAPFLPVAPLELLETAAARPSVGSFFRFVDGIWTGETERDVREGWEVAPDDPAWVVASGGQGYARWYAPTHRRLRARYAAEWGARESRQQGLEYARVAGGKLSARVLPLGGDANRAERAAEPSVAIAGVVSLLPEETAEPGRIEEVAAVFNSRIGAVWLRTLSSGLNFNPGYAARIPLGAAPPRSDLVLAVRAAVETKRRLARFDLLGDDFAVEVLRPADRPLLMAGDPLRRLLGQRAELELGLVTELLEREQRVEQLLARHLGLSEAAREALDTELGLPAAENAREPTGDATASGAAPARVDVERGLPAESELEEQSRRLAVHPRRLFELGQQAPSAVAELDEHVTTARELWVSAERKILGDYLTTLVLRLFGHRWPGSAETTDEPGPDSAQANIWVLRDHVHGACGAARIRELLLRDLGTTASAAVERSAAELLGRSLERWLLTEFCKYHVKRFRRRPLVWQLQSSRFGRQRQPAFVCWVYGRGLDRDTLPKIRSLFVRPLRQRLASQLAAAEGGGGAGEAAGRSAELRALVQELDQFDGRLGEVCSAGFDTEDLGDRLRGEPLDRWCACQPDAAPPHDHDEWLQLERRYDPAPDDGLRVNVAPLQRAGLLAAEVLAPQDVAAAIVARARWRAESRADARSSTVTSLPWWNHDQEQSGHGADDGRS